MEKDKKILLGIIGLILIVAVVIVVLVVKDNKKPTYTADEIKFKEEYEALNNEGNSYNDKKYLELNILEDNNVVYATEKEIVEILKNGDGVIYFGFPNCPWCRAMISTLLEVAHENGIKNVYYLNVLEIRDSYKVESKEVLRTKEGTDSYYKILNELSDVYKVASIETKDTSGISRPSRSRLIPTNTSNSPRRKSLMICIRSIVSISWCIYLTFIPRLSR